MRGSRWGARLATAARQSPPIPLLALGPPSFLAENTLGGPLLVAAALMLEVEEGKGVQLAPPEVAFVLYEI